MVHVKKLKNRPSSQLVESFRKHSVATVHEAMDRQNAMSHEIKPICKGMKICGAAFTVKTHACDNLMVLKAIKDAQNGDVIVVDCGRIKESGPFGELAALECQVKGIEGFITTGSVRDSKEISEMSFPVFSAAISVIGTAKETLGLINHPISVGDVIINPGDIILGDDDGVVVIPLEQASEILEKSNARMSKELKVIDEIRSGKSIFDIYGYQKVFDRQGCIEEK